MNLRNVIGTPIVSTKFGPRYVQKEVSLSRTFTKAVEELQSLMLQQQQLKKQFTSLPQGDPKREPLKPKLIAISKKLKKAKIEFDRVIEIEPVNLEESSMKLTDLISEVKAPGRQIFLDELDELRDKMEDVFGGIENTMEDTSQSLLLQRKFVQAATKVEVQLKIVRRIINEME